MKLYSVSTGIDYEGSSVDVIFDTEEKAVEYIKKKYPKMIQDKEDTRDFNNTDASPFKIDFALIKEHELNMED